MAPAMMAKVQMGKPKAAVRYARWSRVSDDGTRSQMLAWRATAWSTSTRSAVRAAPATRGGAGGRWRRSMRSLTRYRMLNTAARQRTEEPVMAAATWMTIQRELRA